VSRRDDNRQARRAALADAAAILFAELGYDDTPVDLIAEAAGLSRRTFFRYFSAKEDVAFPDHEERLALFADAVEGEGPAWPRIRSGFVALGERLTSERGRVVEQQRIVESSPALVAADRRRDLQWEDVVARALATERSTDEARVLAGALMGAVRATLRAWFATEGATDLVAAGLRAFDLLERGVLDPSGPDQAGV
jgi:AcrR family transcriptional regulator